MRIKMSVEVANFNITFKQVLSTDNLEAVGDLNLSADFLLSVYQDMVRARVFDQKTIALQRTGKLGTYASLKGQEAVNVALGRAMQQKDVYIPCYRDYATLMLRGVTMEEILLYWGGDERGNNYQANAHDLPPCVPIATQCLHAAGVAFALKYQQKQGCAVVTIGDGGTSEGDFYEALNVSGVWDLPIVFVIVNNHWAISVPRNQQSRAKTLAQKGIAAGIEGIQVDGNDIVAMYETMLAATERARKLQQPQLIEAMTYRLGDHTTADDAQRYRCANAIQDAYSLDPILRLQKYLVLNNLWSNAAEEKLQAEVTAQVTEAINNYLNIEKQAPTSMFDHLYQSLPEQYVHDYQELTTL